MRVSESMTNAAVLDHSDDTRAEAARKVRKQQTGSLLVTEGDDLIGIISERDALKAVATGAKLEEARVAEVMTNDVVTVGPRPPCARRPRSWRIGGSATFLWSTAGSWSQ